jgi:hypothetical protein
VDIFISWSGPRSETVALALRDWLPSVLDDHVTPFVSSEDVAKGTRGLDKVADELQKAEHGIIVVTPENATQPWLNFEAGALGNSVTGTKVSPFLVGLDNDAGLVGPMTQFQTTVAADKTDVWKLVLSINSDLDRPLGRPTLQTLFDAQWHVLETVLTTALDAPAGQEAPADRSQDNIIDEILTTVRGLRRDFDLGSTNRARTFEQLMKEHTKTPYWFSAVNIIAASSGFDIIQVGRAPDGSVQGKVDDNLEYISAKAMKQFAELARELTRDVSISGDRLGKFVFTPEGDRFHSSTGELGEQNEMF